MDKVSYNDWAWLGMTPEWTWPLMVVVQIKWLMIVLNECLVFQT